MDTFESEFYFEGDADGYTSDLDRLGDQEAFEDMCAEHDAMADEFDTGGDCGALY